MEELPESPQCVVGAMKLNECLYTENADQNSFVYIMLASRTLLPDGIHIGVGGMGTTGLTPIYAALLAT